MPMMVRSMQALTTKEEKSGDHKSRRFHLRRKITYRTRYIRRAEWCSTIIHLSVTNANILKARRSGGIREMVTATGGYSVLFSIVTEARIPIYSE
ncbi:hypothetical protein T01_5814 [Trichinella spiralis]|uniref:Uncharacterized protein n=1 Tax=Trichinella spiralis TaxID=6334 RepID=A0A0V1B8R6_TRISP|nr:hypothetical protein T01_5814 [Trichinella spiralis]